MDTGVRNTCSAAAAAARTSMTCRANFVDTSDVVADNCKLCAMLSTTAGATRAQGQLSQRGSGAAACTSVMCSHHFFDPNEVAADGCKVPCSALDNGVCNVVQLQLRLRAPR